MRIGVIVFPGSNCDHDAYWALRHNIGADSVFLFHKDHDLQGVDAIILPGGFSYGDYLRSGAIARFSPIMKEIRSFAESGGPVIGICNGFQILCESGMLPGALVRNVNRRFVCNSAKIRVETDQTIFSSELKVGQVLQLPIAHGEGNYYADSETIAKLEADNRVLFRYVDANGKATAEGNPNGSQSNIAGIVNEMGNVLGMMPHPERACDPILGPNDGCGIFQSLITSIGKLQTSSL